MRVAPKRTNYIALIVLITIITAIYTGCGDSQGVAALNTHLSEFNELVENYKATVSTDQSKQAEWDAKITAMAARWTEMRNEFGSDITPQHMDKMVQQYESLMLTLANFKKTLGS